MIKNSVEIRKFTPEQKAQLEAVAKEQGLKNATDVFLFVLDKYRDHVNELARKDWIINYKQKKIERLETPKTG